MNTAEERLHPDHPRQVCKVCAMPQPGQSDRSNHLGGCPYHDRSTCVACKQLEMEGGDNGDE